MKTTFFFLALCLSLQVFGQINDPEQIKVGKYYALLIAVQDYQNLMTTDLDFPIADAENLAKALQNYQFDEVKMLKNPTAKQINEAFIALEDKVVKNDNVLIFYSGHGNWNDKTKNGYWLAADAEENRNNWISNSTIKDNINAINSQHTLLIADACFAGGIFKSKEAFEPKNKSIEDFYKKPSRKGMTSGALTTVPDRSQFLAYLVKNLNENQYNYWAAGSLFQSFREAVMNNTKQNITPQYGVILEAGDEGGEFIFIKRNGTDNKRDLPSEETFTINGVKFEMVYVEGGTFQMGYNASRDGEYADYLASSKPLHTVNLDGFWIAKTEVTQAQWKAVMENNPSHFKGDNLPVENVSWNDCQEYIKKLNAKTAKKYRLPTESQWEYAARGGNKSKNFKYSGSNNIDEVVWNITNSGAKTHDVGSKRANELGLYDMSGNVWEWCIDGYDKNFYETVEANMKNPINNRIKERFVWRGASWNNYSSYSRIAVRNYDDITFKSNNGGFRFVSGF